MNEQSRKQPQTESQPRSPEPASLGASPIDSLGRPWIEQFQRLSTRTRVILLSVAAVVALTIVAFLSRVSSVDSAAATGTLTPLAPRVSPDDAVIRARREAIALAESRRQEVIMLGETVTSTLDELGREVERWKDIEQLRFNDDGKFLAANPDHVQRYATIIAGRRASEAEVDRYRQLLGTLLGTVRAAAGTDSEYVPQDRVVEELRRHGGEIEKAIDAYRQTRTAVESLLGADKKSGKAAEHSLAAAMDEASQRVADENARHIAAMKRQAEQDAALREGEAVAAQVRAQGDQAVKDVEHETRLLEQEAEARRQQKQREADRVVADIQAETNLQAEKAKAVREEAQRKAEHERLLARANDKTVRAEYAPFLTPSRYNLRGRAHETETPKPVSYSEMVASGVMHDHISFAKAGSGILNDSYSRLENTGRPHWPCPTTDEGFEEFKDRYEEFKLLAPHWIELKMLLP